MKQRETLNGLEI